MPNLTLCDKCGKPRTSYKAQKLYDKRPRLFWWEGKLYGIKTKMFWESDDGDLIWFGIGRTYHVKHDCPSRETVIKTFKRRAGR